MISSSVSLIVLQNLVNYSSAAYMWATLCAFYQQISKENIYMIQNSFFEYKMSVGDSINTHIEGMIFIYVTVVDKSIASHNTHLDDHVFSACERVYT
jgi:hypothetical protein